MSNPTPNPVQQTVKSFVDELEMKLRAVLGTVGGDLKQILGHLRSQVHQDAATGGEQAGQDVTELKQAAADAAHPQTPPAT